MSNELKPGEVKSDIGSGGGTKTTTKTEFQWRCSVCQEPVEGSIVRDIVCDECRKGTKVLTVEKLAPTIPPKSSGVLTLKEFVGTPGNGCSQKFFSSCWEEELASAGQVIQGRDTAGYTTGVFSASLFVSFIPCLEIPCDPMGKPFPDIFNLDGVPIRLKGK